MYFYIWKVRHSGEYSHMMIQSRRILSLSKGNPTIVCALPWHRKLDKTKNWGGGNLNPKKIFQNVKKRNLKNTVITCNLIILYVYHLKLEIDSWTTRVHHILTVIKWENRKDNIYYVRNTWFFIKQFDKHWKEVELI